MRVTQLLHQLRTQGSSPGREAAAVGLGVFIGCLPLYGFHLLLCIAVSTLFGLNRLKTYLAANISNPLVAPWLIFAEIQVGAWLRRDTVHQLSLDTLKTTGLWVFGLDLVVGSIAVGAVLAGLGAWGTFVLAGRSAGDDFAALVRRAADRYASASITAWEFARGKLRYDPIYRALLFDGLLTVPGDPAAARGTLVDVGCGQGVTLALLAEARGDVRAGRRLAAHPGGVGAPADAAAPPVFERLVGIELRPRAAALAAAALQGEAEITAVDARAAVIERADAVLFLDVLHMIPYAEQETLLAQAGASLSPDGVIVIREVDAAGGWRFRMVAFGNRLKAILFGNWGQRFHFRSVEGWQSCLSALGLHAESRPMGQGTPFANVVFVVRRGLAATSSSRRTDTSSAGAS